MILYYLFTYLPIYLSTYPPIYPTPKEIAMPLRFAPNLSMLYGEVPFLERFGRAAAAGFRAVEFLFPYEFGAVAIRQRLEEHGLRPVLFNINPGDWQQGERGTLGNPAR